MKDFLPLLFFDDFTQFFQLQNLSLIFPFLLYFGDFKNIYFMCLYSLILVTCYTLDNYPRLVLRQSL